MHWDKVTAGLCSCLDVEPLHVLIVFAITTLIGNLYFFLKIVDKSMERDISYQAKLPYPLMSCTFIIIFTLCEH